MRRAIAALAALGCGAGAAPGYAASCAISAQPVAFGAYDPLAPAADDATGQVTVTCSNPVNLLLAYSVALSAGTGSFANRQLAAGGHRLSYNLYVDAARLIVWGDGTAGTSKVSNLYLVTLLGVATTHTVYGRAPARQNVAVGTYTDTITATVEY